MASADEFSLVPSVAQRFKEATKTLETMNEQWSALAAVEEQQTLTSESLNTAAVQIAEMSRTMASNCEAMKEAMTELRSAIDAASTFLENNDFTRMQAEMKKISENLDAMHSEVAETLTAQLQQAVSERDTALAEAESAANYHQKTRQELEDQLAVTEAQYSDLKARAETLPKRMRHRLLGSIPPLH